MNTRSSISVGVASFNTRVYGVLVATKRYAFAHKVISLVMIMVLAGLGWWGYTLINAGRVETRYVLGTVARGTIIASVSGSGQVSASNQLDIKPKVSGEITKVNVEPGQHVATGALIAVIDPTDAQKAVRDAAVNLQSAEISLQKLQKPATALSLAQAEHSAENAVNDLQTNYTDGYNDVVNTFLDLPDIVLGLEDVLTGTTASKGSQWNIDYYENAISTYDIRAAVYRDTAYDDYMAAKKAYDNAFTEYQAAGGTNDPALIEKLLSDTYATNQLVSKAIKSANAFIQFYTDQLKAHDQASSATAVAALTTLNGYTSTTNGHLSTLLSSQNSIRSGKQSVTETAESLRSVQAGTDALDLQSVQLTLTQRQNALTDAKNTLAEYYVYAPFSGTIATVAAKRYDTAGSGTTLATLITSQKVVTLSLNEVDATKVVVGNKATMTFDAIDDLTLTGKVVEVDTIGTVSQGVVSYSVKIGFDSQDTRIKSGMTVNATIQTEVHQNALFVPSGAVKTQQGVSVVQVFTPALADTGDSTGVVSTVAPHSVEVQIGISDDTSVEITSGLTEGEQIVTRTITGAAANTSGTTNGTNRNSGIGGGTGIRL